MGNVEFVVNRRTGEVRQAGSDRPGKFIEEFRREAASNLFVFNKGVLGLDRMTTDLHLPTCNWLTDLSMRRRKLLLLPRNHLKCVARDYFLNRASDLPTSLGQDGKISKTEWLIEDRGVIEQCYRVTTHSGRYVDITANHPFLTWGGKWKALEEGLRVGDWVGISRRGVFGDTHSPALAKLVGWCLADAYLEGQSVTCKDPEEREELKQCILDAGFGYTESGVQVRIKGMEPLWAQWGLLECKSEAKFIPSWIFKGDEETIRAFLKGLLKDASYKSAAKQPGVVSYTTISPRLTQDIQHLLIKFGLRPHRQIYLNDRGQYKHQPLGYRWFTITFTDWAGVYGEPFSADSSLIDQFPAEWRDRIPYGKGYWLRQQGERVDNHFETTRAKVGRVASLLGDSWLIGWVQSDVAWERITSIEPLGAKAIVSIESPLTHTLALGDIITHNTSILRGLVIHMTIQDAETNIYWPGKEGTDMRLLWAGEAATHAENQLGWVERQYESNELLRALWPHRMWANPPKEAPKWNQQVAMLPRKKDFPEATITTIGVGGAITGHHFDVLIKDDLVTFEASQSDVVMQTAWEWHNSSRDLWDDRARGLEFILGTRWAAQDIYEQMMTGDPTLDLLIRQVVEEGRPIFPSMFPMEVILELEKAGPLFWLNYMNTTDTPEISDFDINMIRYYEMGKEGKLWFDDRLGQEVPEIARHAVTMKELLEHLGPGYRVRRS